MNPIYEKVRADVHEMACEALSTINKIERDLDADLEGWLYAPEKCAEVKAEIAETRSWVMAEYRRVNAKVDAHEKGSQP
jgi:predicted secreted Zn-dependent protease